MKKRVFATVMILMMTVSGCGRTKAEATQVTMVYEEAADGADEMTGTVDTIEAETVYKSTEALKNGEELTIEPEREPDTEKIDIDEHYKELMADLVEDIEKYKKEYDLNGAYKEVYDACKEYPQDETLNVLQQELLSMFPSSAGEDNIIDKRYCKVGNEWFTGVYGEQLNADFNINLGGGSISLDLREKYTKMHLKAMFSDKSPTKAKVDIDIYGDGALLYSLADFNTEEGQTDIFLDVEGIYTLAIESADHDHAWVGETVFKPDTACHYALLLYEEKDLEWVEW